MPIEEVYTRFERDGTRLDNNARLSIEQAVLDQAAFSVVDSLGFLKKLSFKNTWSAAIANRDMANLRATIERVSGGHQAIEAACAAQIAQLDAIAAEIHRISAQPQRP